MLYGIGYEIVVHSLKPFRIDHNAQILIHSSKANEAASDCRVITAATANILLHGTPPVHFRRKYIVMSQLYGTKIIWKHK